MFVCFMLLIHGYFEAVEMTDAALISVNNGLEIGQTGARTNVIGLNNLGTKVS